MPGERNGDQGWAFGRGRYRLGNIRGESDSTVCHHLEPKTETLALQQNTKFASVRNYLVEVVLLMVFWRPSHMGSYRS